MRMSTPCYIAIREVGKEGSAESIELMYGPLKDNLLGLMKFIANNPLHRRFDICIGRDDNECVERLKLEGRSPKNSGPSGAESDVMNLLDELLAEQGVEEL